MLVQAKEAMEDWATELKAHYEGAHWDINMERRAPSRKHQKLLDLEVFPRASVEEVMSGPIKAKVKPNFRNPPR
jgi:hypothetical protein